MEAAGVPGAAAAAGHSDRGRRRALRAARLLHPLGGASLLAGFCVLAALLFHYHPGDLMQMINFMKNITIAGGFLVLAGAGPGALALDNRR